MGFAMALSATFVLFNSLEMPPFVPPRVESCNIVLIPYFNFNTNHIARQGKTCCSCETFIANIHFQARP